MRKYYQLLHDSLGVGCTEHVLHQLGVLSHLLKEGLHPGRGEEGGPALAARLRVGAAGGGGAACGWKTKSIL